MRNKLCLVAAVAGLVAQSAQAALIVDLRFEDGSKSKAVSAGTHVVNIWAQVTGANSNPDERLLSLFGSVRSEQVLNGVLNSGTSGVTGTTAVTVFSNTSPNGQPGTTQNQSADGIQDWGAPTTLGTSAIKFNSTLNLGLEAVSTTTLSAVWNGITGGVEFLVGKLTVTINAQDVKTSPQTGAATRFNWVKATGPLASHYHYIDSSTSALSGSSDYAASTQANSVSFTSAVPEPTMIGLIGVAAALGLRRRLR